MTVLYIVAGDPGYPRNRIIIDGLRAQGVTVHEYRLRDHGRRPSIGALGLLWTHRKLTYDVMWVGPSGAYLMPLCRLISRGPVVLDVYFSMYQTVVEDKRLCRRGSLRARFYRFLDVLSCRLAHRVVLDTRSQIRYFLREYRLWPGKFCCIPVGADERIFEPRQEPLDDAPFQVRFWGSFIPLQGVSVILQAAARLAHADVVVSLLGDGPGRPEAARMAQRLGLTNVRLLPRTDAQGLAEFQAGAHLCLGIFGATEKARQVIPNKAYCALASGRALVTGDSPAAREQLTHRTDAWLVPMDDPAALADAVLYLKEHADERRRLAAAGRALFVREFTTDRIGAGAVALLDEVSAARAIPSPGPVPPGMTAVADEINPAMMLDHRPDLAALVPVEATRILDVGCGVGYLGECLKARDGVEVTGLEISVAAARQAAGRLDAVFTSFDELAHQVYAGYFDCMVFGDVLEHMASPRQELRRYLELLRHEGTVVVSVPNVAHWTVGWQLLRNRFDYEARGIRCESHLRFFTSRTVRELLESVGLRVRRMLPAYRLFDGSLLGVPLRFPGLCRVLGLGVFRHLLAFQYRFTAVKHGVQGSLV